MSKMIDMIGQQYNNWLVLEKAGTTKSGNIQWLCECQCENKTKSIITGSNLRNGHSKKCKICVNKEKGERSRKDYTGYKFGKITVISYTGNSNLQGNAIWKCLCDCGRYTEISSNNFNKTMSCGMCGMHSKGELKIEQLLKENNINFITQYSLPDLVSETNTRLYFDFYVENHYIIEYDGEQHFDFNGRGWNSKENFEKLKQRDQLKNEYCFKNNIPIIRIPYTHFNELKIEDLLLKTSKFILK